MQSRLILKVLGFLIIIFSVSLLPPLLIGWFDNDGTLQVFLQSWGGLLLLGPGVVYPGHHHEPKEVYLVMTPGSQWCLDEGDWFDVAPGDLVFHDSWKMHAMRTRDKPLLAFAGWLDAGDRRGISWSGNNGGVRFE